MADLRTELVCRAYLHPEVLATETLIGILKERCIQLDKLDRLNKSELVELFYDHVLPLPQRIYGMGRRAERLTQRRQKNESLKRKCEESDNWMSQKIIKNDSRSCDVSKSERATESPKRCYRLVNRNSASVPSKMQVLEKPVMETNHREKETQKSDQSPTKKSKRTPISWP